MALKLHPFFLGGVMKASGNQPPGVLAARGAFLIQDVRRSAALHDVPLLDISANFFKSALAVSRVRWEWHGFYVRCSSRASATKGC